MTPASLSPKATSFELLVPSPTKAGSLTLAFQTRYHFPSNNPSIPSKLIPFCLRGPQSQPRQSHGTNHRPKRKGTINMQLNKHIRRNSHNRELEKSMQTH